MRFIFLFFISLVEMGYGLVDFSVPEKKIAILILPKSGTHLLRKAIECITTQSIRWIGPRAALQFSVQEDLSLPHRIIFGHLFPEMDLIRTDYSDRYIKVLLIRDPRDVILSFSHHLANRLSWSQFVPFDSIRFIALPQDEQLRETLLLPDEFRGPAVCFLPITAWIDSDDVYVCRFEDLVGSKGGGSDEKQFLVLKELAEHIECVISDGELREIGAKFFGGTWTFREGKIGAWQRSYNEENKILFKQLYQPYIEAFGYEVNSFW